MTSTHVPARIGIKLRDADRAALTRVLTAITVPHRKAPSFAEGVRAALAAWEAANAAGQ